MKLLFAFLLFAVPCSFAQVHFIIINADTKKPLVHIPVSIGEKNGIYSNAQGEINIPEVYEVQEITINALGYEPYYAQAGDIQNTTISLNPVAYSLPDIVIRGTPKKLKTLRQKAMRSNDAVNGHFQYHGVECGVYIPDDKDDAEMQLLEITIPVVTNQTRIQA